MVLLLTCEFCCVEISKPELVVSARQENSEDEKRKREVHKNIVKLCFFIFVWSRTEKSFFGGKTKASMWFCFDRQ